MPLAMFGSDRVPYEFLKRVRYDPHIITAGNADRPKFVPPCELPTTTIRKSRGGDIVWRWKNIRLYSRTWTSVI
jgi:hypothetical protein